jgi:hypothetical protein
LPVLYALYADIAACPAVPNCSGRSEEITMSENEHPKDFTIVVNGREKVVTQRELLFGALVTLAFENLPGTGNTIYTITYRRGEGNKHEGTLVEGESVKVKDRMIFNVTATDKS